MENNLHDIDDLFRSKLGDYKALPSQKVWEEIDSGLDKENIDALRKKYNNVRKYILLLLLLAAGAGFYQLNKPDDMFKSARSGNAGTQINNFSNTNHNHRPTEKNNEMKMGQPSSSTLHNNAAGKNSDVRAMDSKAWMKNEVIMKTYPGNKTGLIPGINSENIHTALLPVQSGWLHLVKTGKADPVAAGSFADIQLLLQKKNIPVSVVNIHQASKGAGAKRFSFSSFFSHDFASYHLKDNNTGSQQGNAVKIQKSERHEYSASGGVLVDFRLNHKWTLQSGLTFSHTEIAIDPSIIYAQPDDNGSVKYRINISSGYGYLVPSFQPLPSVGDSAQVTATAHKLQYLGIPVAVKYNITGGRISIAPVAGVSFNFLTRGKLETEIQKGPDHETDVLSEIEGLKAVYINGQAGMLAEYKVSGRWSFILMPSAKFALGSINKSGVVKSYPNSLGIAAGLKISF